MSLRQLKIVVLVLLSVLLAGCGEYRQAVPYEHGGYQGKKDERLWESERFMRDPAVWKQFINERTERQNEYQRAGNVD